MYKRVSAGAARVIALVHGIRKWRWEGFGVGAAVNVIERGGPGFWAMRGRSPKAPSSPLLTRSSTGVVPPILTSVTPPPHLLVVVSKLSSIRDLCSQLNESRTSRTNLHDFNLTILLLTDPLPFLPSGPLPAALIHYGTKPPQPHRLQPQEVCRCLLSKLRICIERSVAKSVRLPMPPTSVPP